MRSLSLVECIEVKFTGKILKEGVSLGDCDNDGLNELVVGNTDGDLFIYRGDRCICKAHDLGTISAIAVGDLLNISRNVMIVITIEGWCHVFDVEFELNMEDMKDDLSSIDASASIADYKVVQPFHSQRIVCNIKSAKLADVNNDGKTELVVGLTDRVLRIYQWCSEVDFEEGDKNELDERSEDQRSESSELVFNGKLKALNKWEFPNQIGSVALHKQPDKGVCILVGQPGGTVSKISACKPREKDGLSLQILNKEPTEASNSNVSRSRNPSSCSSFDVEHFSLNLGKIQNPSTSTEVVGNVFPAEATENPDHYAVATLDGTIMLCHEDSFEIVTQLETPVLSLEALNGSFVVVGWEGETYLVKRSIHPEVENCIVRFNFEESVAAFKVGPYALPQNDQEDVPSLCNKNCFVYATFHESIYIYPNQFI